MNNNEHRRPEPTRSEAPKAQTELKGERGLWTLLYANVFCLNAIYIFSYYTVLTLQDYDKRMVNL